MRSLSYLLVASMFYVSAAKSQGSEEEKLVSDGVPVRIALVETRPITQGVSTYGVLAPKIEDLSFRIDGRISAFNVAEGDLVEEGQALAELEAVLLAEEGNKQALAAKADATCWVIEHLRGQAAYRQQQAKRLAELSRSKYC